MATQTIKKLKLIPIAEIWDEYPLRSPQTRKQLRRFGLLTVNVPAPDGDPPGGSTLRVIRDNVVASFLHRELGRERHYWEAEELRPYLAAMGITAPLQAREPTQFTQFTLHHSKSHKELGER